MTREKIQKLWERYQKEECTAEEKDHIDKWLDSVLGKEPDVVVDLKVKEFQLHEYIHQAIQSEAEFDKKEVVLDNAGSFKHYWIAAALVIISCSVLIFFVNWNPTPHIIANEAATQKSTDIVENNEQEVKEIRLIDGSVVILEPGGKIDIAPSFRGTKERIIHLEGKAFFRVSHNKNRPFIVVTEHLIAKVLGTTFSIKARKGEESTIEVKTGKVAVYRKQGKKIQVDPDSFVAITANHQIRFDSTTKRLVESLVERPSMIPTIERTVSSKSSITLDSHSTKMIFKHVSAIETLNALQEAYGIRIRFDQSKIAGCIITVTIDTDNFYTWLQTICDLIGGKYQANGNEIEIISPGCK